MYSKGYLSGIFKTLVRFLKGYRDYEGVKNVYTCI